MSSGAGRGRRARQRSGLGPRRVLPRLAPRRCRSPARLAVCGRGWVPWGRAVPGAGGAPAPLLQICPRTSAAGAVPALSGVCRAALTLSSSFGAAPSGSTRRAPRPCAAWPSPSPRSAVRSLKKRSLPCPALPCPQPPLHLWCWRLARDVPYSVPTQGQVFLSGPSGSGLALYSAVALSCVRFQLRVFRKHGPVPTMHCAARSRSRQMASVHFL